MASAAAASQRVSVPSSHASAPLSQSLRSSINAALVANNAVPAIQSALLHECQASGFTAAIRTRAIDLLRSGTCSTYAEVMHEIMTEIKNTTSAEAPGGAAQTNGENGTDGERRLKVPRKVVEEGVKVVRAALESCVDIVAED